jgi:hypothetical protein
VRYYTAGALPRLLATSRTDSDSAKKYLLGPWFGTVHALQMPGSPALYELFAAAGETTFITYYSLARVLSRTCASVSPASAAVAGTDRREDRSSRLSGLWRLFCAQLELDGTLVSVWAKIPADFGSREPVLDHHLVAESTLEAPQDHQSHTTHE